MTSDIGKLCVVGYSRTVGHTSGQLKHAVYLAYGISREQGFHGEIDHRVPLALGGADTFNNLWPLSIETRPLNKCHKDTPERLLHRAVCRRGRIGITEAQAVFLGDWRTGYWRYAERSARR